MNPIIIPSVILSVYTERLFLSVYIRMKFYHWVNSVGKVVGKSYMSSYFSGFFYSFFSNCNSLSIYLQNVSIGVY